MSTASDSVRPSPARDDRTDRERGPRRAGQPGAGLAVGAQVDDGQVRVGLAERGDESFRWVTLADPQGNQFCIAKH